MITLEQAEIIEQLISDCADEVDSDFYSDGGRVVARKLYRLATVIRAIRCGRGMDIVEYVGQVEEWALRAGGVTRHG